ncbi:methylglutaconyl-CoA hydratase [Filimonas lacunae]|uniref:Methylglutaconyl-CoA hydratase n=1 Tax=Filimonas lacunae TaxID=477680 RepID=A0A173MQ02_9BACT|nr:enoyl-CoA hydratase-related protein [Filimonas lacunae]BAV09567.1 methylglutaconyl-CoA hydratase [Filimonas lacunae]SIS75338.1 methylglutaconyl-CoA hydratase [Filimonas lacunae]
MIIEVKDVQEGYVKSETHNHVTTIEFFHPQGNSLPGKILADLAHEIVYAGNDKTVNVIVIRSAGTGAFCGGASFDELATIKTEAEGKQFFSGFANVINAMRKCPKLIIARIHGKCVGGGVGLAAAADYAIAVEGAEVKLSELTVGIGPFVVGPAIERKTGLSGFTQLAIDASHWRNGDWARRKGLFAELHPTLESMEESIQRLTHTLSHSNPDAIAELKKEFWKGTEHWDQLLMERAAISGKLILSEHSKQALKKIFDARAKAKA